MRDCMRRGLQETTMKCTKAELLEALHELLGDAGLKTSPADLDSYGKDWTKVYKLSLIHI